MKDIFIKNVCNKQKVVYEGKEAKQSDNVVTSM